MSNKIPRSKENDCTPQLAAERRAFVQEKTGAALDHVGGFSFDPAVLPGNVENFIGVAQVPIGLAGPPRIVGEHARGDFYIPPGGANYILSGNMDTDKKHSRANMLLTRGKRVVAECTIRGDLLKSLMGISAKDLFWARQVSNAGAFSPARPTTARMRPTV